MDTPTRRIARLICPALALVLPLTGCSKEAKKARTISSADKYFKAGEYEKAKIEYLNVLKVDPGNAVAIRQLGLIWSEQGAPLRALPYLARAKELEPNNLNVRMKLARAVADMGQVPDARKEALSILQKNPSEQEAIYLLMDTSRSQEDFDAVQKAVEKFQAGGAVPHLHAANLAMKSRDLDAAQAELDKALAADPKSARAHMAQANLNLVRRNLDQAEPEFRLASDLSPVRSLAHLRFGEILAQRGKDGEAAAWVDGVTKAAPDFIPAWIVRARLALSEKKFDESLAHLQKVFAIDGGNLEGRLLEGQALLAKKEVAKALERLEALDKSFPGVPVVKYHLARAYVRASKTPQAMAALNKAIAANPGYSDAILLLAELDLRAGNTQAVIDAMLGLLKKQPESAEAQFFLAAAYTSSGKLAEAATLLEQRVKALPDDTRSQLQLGLVLRQQGKRKEAREAFAKAEELVPDSLLPLSQLVEMDLLEKDFASALQRVEARLAKDPTLAGAWFLKGRIYGVQGSFDQAEAAFQKTIDLDPSLVGAYDMLATVYVSTGKLEKAIEQLNLRLAKDPDNKSALMVSGVLYGQLKNIEKAQSAYEKALAVDPDFAPALNNLAWIYLENLNQPEKALESAGKARSVQPSNAAIADTYGWVLYRRGDYQQSLAILRDAASQLSENPEVSYHLGMAAYMMGDKDLARKSLQAAAASKKAFSGKEEIAVRLALLPEAGQKQTDIAPDDLRKVLESQPQDTFGWMRLGELYEEQKAFDKAASAYERVLQVNPKLLPAVVRLASINAESLHNYAKAMEWARSARELAPKDPAVAALAGNVALNGGNYSQAYSLLQEAARGNADNPGVFYDLATATYSLGRVKEACETMQKVIALAPDDPRASTFLRFVSPDGKVAGVSADDVEATLKSAPTYVPALMARATAEEQRADSKSAIATYNEVLKVYPAFAPAQKRLAGLYVDTPENKDKAYSLAVEARKTFPDDLELTRTLAAISYQRGEFPYAVQLLDTIAKSSPLGAKENFYLGMARYKTKALPASKKALQTALDGGLAEPMATEAKRVLAELKSTK